MAEEEAEEGPFEIRDFSVASPWEELISTVEEAVRAWLRGAADSCAFHPLRHGRRELLLSCHGEPDERQCAPADGALPQFMSEMLDAHADFRAGEAFSKDSVERLRRWFGLQTFVLLQPATPESLDASEMALLQGTLNVALLNCGCAVPGFVSHEPARGGFCGRASGDGGAAYASLGCRFDVDCFALTLTLSLSLSLSLTLTRTRTRTRTRWTASRRCPRTCRSWTGCSASSATR